MHETNKIFNGRKLWCGGDDTCGVTRQSLARCVQQQLGVLLLLLLLPPPCDQCTVRGSALLDLTPSLRPVPRLDVFPAVLCDCASRWYHNSHGFHCPEMVRAIGLIAPMDEWRNITRRSQAKTIIRRKRAHGPWLLCLRPSISTAHQAPVSLLLLVCFRYHILAFNGK